jgi:hypothetical protein
MKNNENNQSVKVKNTDSSSKYDVDIRLTSKEYHDLMIKIHTLEEKNATLEDRKKNRKNWIDWIIKFIIQAVITIIISFITLIIGAVFSQPIIEVLKKVLN